MIRPMNSQRLFPDITFAPLRTKGESEASGAAVLSGASIETIKRSAGSWFGTSCIYPINSIGWATALVPNDLTRFLPKNCGVVHGIGGPGLFFLCARFGGLPSDIR